MANNILIYQINKKKVKNVYCRQIHRTPKRHINQKRNRNLFFNVFFFSKSLRKIKYHS